MSDIYLAITETPTVVTLTSAVISSAVASTVTVANTVTVALDANSLSALENVTVTVGAAITGTVTVSNFPAFPATQPVSIASVTIGSLPAISGTVTVGNSLTISSLPAISGTVTASLDASGVVGFDQPIPSQGIQLGYNASGEFLGVSPSSRLPVDVGDIVVGGRRSLGGTIYSLPVNQNGEDAGDLGMPIGFNYGGSFKIVEANYPLPISGTVTVGNTVTIAGTVTANPTGTQTIAGSVTLGAGTAQIGSVTASISGTVPISISSVTVGNSVTISSLPALVAGTAQIGSVTASISNSVTIGSLPLISGTVTANTFALQGTAVTTSDFTSTTASTLLAGFNAGREVLTIFSEGPGTLFVCPGATCTTIAYQVRLSSGDYYEVPNHQTTITHSAVFATAGTARVTQVS